MLKNFFLMLYIPCMIFSKNPDSTSTECRFKNFAGNIPSELCRFRDGILKAYQSKTDKRGGLINEFLLRGPSGTGKCALAKAFAESIGAKEFTVDARQLAENKSYNELAMLRGITNHYQEALDYHKSTGKPIVIIIRHAEEFCGVPQHERHDNFHQTLKASNFMLSDHKSDPRIIFFLTTDYPHIKDQTVTRTWSLYFSLPDESNRSEMFTHFLKDAKHQLSDGFMQRLIHFTDGFVGADIETAIKYAELLAHKDKTEIREEHLWEGIFNAIEENDRLSQVSLKQNRKRYQSLKRYSEKENLQASDTSLKFFSRLTLGFSHHDLNVLMKSAQHRAKAENKLVTFSDLVGGFWDTLQTNRQLYRNYFMSTSATTATTLFTILATYIMIKRGGWRPR